jgi:hypothetical protein
MTNLSLAQLRKAVAVKERIDELQAELNQILGESGAVSAPIPGMARIGRGRKRSAAVRARMAAAQRARWANKSKTSFATTRGTPTFPTKRRKRHFSPEAIARISAAAKARWARAKASGKHQLG